MSARLRALERQVAAADLAVIAAQEEARRARRAAATSRTAALEMKIATDDARAQPRSERREKRELADLLEQLEQLRRQLEAGLDATEAVDDVAERYSNALGTLLTPDAPEEP